MNDSQVGDFSKLLGQVLAFYRQDVSAFAVDVFWQTLQRFDLDEVTKAFSLYVQDPDQGKWPPKPADILRLLEGHSGDRSLTAWAKVDRTVRTIGPYQTVVFDDELIHAVIDDMGGWLKLCETTDKDWPFVSNEFRKRYQGMVMRRPETYPPKLIGITEFQNARFERHIPQPMLIGDHQKALKVLEHGATKDQRALPLSEVMARIETAKTGNVVAIGKEAKR